MCTSCGEAKNVDLFNRDYRYIDRTRSSCIECERVKSKRYYDENKESLRKSRRSLSSDGYEKKRAMDRESYKKHRVSIASRRKVLRSREGEKVKIICRSKTKQAIKDGSISTKDKCLRCGSSVNIQCHHNDYTNHLDVIFVCVKCHAHIHRMLRERAVS